MIDRLSLSVLSVSVREKDNEDNLIASAFVWDYTDNDDVLILTNYHTWTCEEFKYCFPPTESKKKGGRKRKVTHQDPVQIVLHNADINFECTFVVTGDMFKYCNETQDYAVLQVANDGNFTMPRIPVYLGVSITLRIHAMGYPAHTGSLNVTGGEVSGYITYGFTMNLLSAPGLSGAAIICDSIGRAVGYMGGNLDVSKEKNAQHQSYGFRFDHIISATNRKESPSNSPAGKGGSGSSSVD